MPRLVRREPLSERMKAYLNPYDFLLWLSEELHESAWDEALKDWGVPIGLAANLLFIITRANTGSSPAKRRDDVFGDFDGRRGSGWLSWFASSIVHLLMLASFLNALYTFLRNRHYRLFESSIEQAPSTPSARRVRVDSSPISSSPLRYVTSMLASTTAKARAHPDEKQDVWEVSVWDPKDSNLELFTMFSPGHVLVYCLLLPTTASDARPSVTIFTAIVLGVLMTLQLGGLRRFFLQQAKDNRLIQKEVMNEYDTKYVHPTLNRPVRDVGVQTRETATSPRARTREVDVYTPTTIINRGFKVNPNPSYASHLSDGIDVTETGSPLKRLPRSSTTSSLRTPMNGGGLNNYKSFGAQTTERQPSDYSQSPLKAREIYRPRERSPVKGDGGSLGVFSHAASPLRKAASSNLLRPNSAHDEAHGGRPRTNGGSHLKRMSTPASSSLSSTGSTVGGERDHLTDRFNGLSRRESRPY